MSQLSTTTTLQILANALEEQYLPRMVEEEFASGRTFNSMFKPMDHPIVGDGENIKLKTRKGDSFRPTRDALADFPNADQFEVEQFKVRFNETLPTRNDFCRLSGTIRITEYMRQRAASSEAATVDLVAEMGDDFQADFSYKLSVCRNLDRTCRLGTVGGTKRNNSSEIFADCTVYSAGATSCRFKVSGAPIAYFREGQLLDVYNSSGTLILDKVRIADRPNGDPDDMSVAVEITNLTTLAANCDAIANAHELYWSDSRNQGMYSVGEWKKRASAGESFIGGIDRTSPSYRHLQCRTFGTDRTAAQKISKADFDRVGDAYGAEYDKPEVGWNVRLAPVLNTALRDQFEAAAFVQWPTGGSSDVYANYGSKGLNFVHPALGRLVLQADPFMLPDRFDMDRFGDWMACYYGQKGLVTLPGDLPGGWYRLQSAVPGGGKTMLYQKDAYGNFVDVCLNAKGNCRFHNVSKS